MDFMTLRKIVFWLHLCAGVFAGIVVLIMSITGVALTYQKQMTEWADRSYWPAPAAPGSPLMPIGSLIEQVLKENPAAKPSAVVFYAEAGSPAVVTAGPGRNLIVDRHTGKVAGEGSKSIRDFFSVMTTWHRYLGADATSRPVGKAITGACNLAFLFIVVSGFFLWWPRTWTRQALRSVTWFKSGVKGRARDFNWHNVFGFWTAIPLFLVVLSATVISYPWASNLVYRIAGSGPPQQNAPRPAPSGQIGQREGTRAAPPPVLSLADVDTLLDKAEREVPGWRTINLRLPTAEDKEVTFVIDQGWGGQPQLRSTLTLERGSGKIARLQTFDDQNLGQRARSWLRFVHTGEFYGVAGQTVAGVASFAGVMLAITGFMLVVRRFLGWIGRKWPSRQTLPGGSRIPQQTYEER
jgi:uncharacterized iron-regulated membrane protein